VCTLTAGAAPSELTVIRIFQSGEKFAIAMHGTLPELPMSCCSVMANVLVPALNISDGCYHRLPRQPAAMGRQSASIVNEFSFRILLQVGQGVSLPNLEGDASDQVRQ
jgi:hypothetical protein